MLASLVINDEIYLGVFLIRLTCIYTSLLCAFIAAKIMQGLLPILLQHVRW